ncbi:MAG: hypothetical protein ABF335_02930 [Alphaproteobacteria bacterium]
MRKSLLIGAAALSMAYTAQAVAEMPAVTGFNGKVEGGYGQLDGEDNFAVGGSVAIPLIEQLGIQIDANAGMLGENEDFTYGAGLSTFWRSSSIGSFGVSVAYLDVDEAAWISRYEAEGEVYLGNITLGGDFGFQDSDWGDDGAFYGGAKITLYAMPNLALTGGADVFGFDGDEDVQANLGVEFGVLDMLSLYADGKLGSESEDSIFVGARLAFGSNSTDLIKQHREYSKRGNAVNDMLRENDTFLKNAAAVNAVIAAGGSCPIPSPLDPLCLLPIF